MSQDLPDSTSPNQVYQLTEGWNFIVTNTGTSGTKSFIDAAVYTPNASEEIVDLPQIGDSFSSEYPNTLLDSISISYIGNNENCGKKYICSYTGIASTMEMGSRSQDFPKSVDIGGELRSIVIKSPACKWRLSGQHVDQPIFKRITLIVYKMSRVVEDYDEFMATNKLHVNKINSVKFFECQPNTLLYNGATLTEYFDNYSVKRWKADMQWTFRSVTGNTTGKDDGWRWTLNETSGNWDIVDYPWELYEESDFKGLLDISYTSKGKRKNQTFPSY